MAPIIKILEGPTPTQKGLSHAVLSGGTSLVSALSKAADIVPFEQEELFGVLHFRIHTAEKAKQRSRWFGGRFYNEFSGEDPDYIPLSGTHLCQTLEMAGIQPPEIIVASGKYLLRLDVGQSAYEHIASLRAS